MLTWGMTLGGLAALVAGLVFVRARARAARGAERWLALGPVFEATALTMFGAEHFFLAQGMAPMVPRWVPGPGIFWIYFFGVALLAAAVSLILWRGVRASSLLLAAFFLLMVGTLSLPQLPKGFHERLLWTLTTRETSFAAGALVLAGSQWPRGSRARKALVRVGRGIVALVMVFYGVQHFFFPGFVPGVPLEKPMPAWVPAHQALAFFVGAVLVVAGLALLARRRVATAAAVAGAVLVVLVLFFYVPILLMELHTRMAIEGLNYVGDTLLFAATVMLTGWAPEV